MPKLYGCWQDAHQIDWENLPNKFVIKCNHGAKWNIICRNKKTFDIEQAQKKLECWLRMDYGQKEFEVHYSHIKPLVFAEEYIEPSTDDLLPVDYKIYCFNGIPRIILVCLDRETELKLEWYDFEWNVYDIGTKKNEQIAKRPKNLSKMWEFAERLSKPFPFVRVDFYDTDYQPVLGELTFTPMYGMAKYYSAEGNKKIGDMLALPSKYGGRFR